MSVWSHEVLILGQPVPKGRPRLGRNGRTYTPATTRRAERSVRSQASDQLPGPAPGPVELEVEFVLAIPPSWDRWKRNLAREGLFPHVVKPDLDNLLKLFKDALNGVAWGDDAGVVLATAWKRYTLAGEEPHTRARITSQPVPPRTLAEWRRCLPDLERRYLGSSPRSTPPGSARLPA